VTDYGAVPDDEMSDFEAIQKTIDAAELSGGGIVFFPAGRFLVTESEGMKSGFLIKKSNIVIKGSGSGEGGTEIFMRHSLVPEDTSKKWSTPPLFQFQYQKGAYYLNTSGYKKDERKVISQVVSPAEKNSFVLELSDTSRLKAGDCIAIRMVSPLATKKYLEGVELRPIWTHIIMEGLTICEKHQIKEVTGNRVTLMEPIRIEIDTTFNWDIYKYPVAENWGVEDIFFQGNFNEEFVHHKDYIHDSGWTLVNMSCAKNSWIRRCRIANVSQGFTFSGCIASSMLLNRVEGNRGHTNFSSQWGYGCLIGLSDDITEKGSWHGPNTSHLNVGLVVWKYTANEGAGPDFHAYCPHTTLWDCSQAYIQNNGGSFNMQPNHLWDFTFWNFKQTGDAIDQFDFWELPKNEEEKKSKYFGAAKVLKPNVVGFHGSETSFKESSLGIFESIGEKVFPESLYEAQLELRLGYKPKWIEEYEAEWAKR
jgi:hypothetical protein